MPRCVNAGRHPDAGGRMEEPVHGELADGDGLLGIGLRRVRPRRPLHAVGPDGDTPPRASSTAWEGRYRAWVIGCDLFAILLVIAGATLLILRVTGRPYFLHAS